MTSSRPIDLEGAPRIPKQFGPQGVCIIEDYRPDLEGFVHHD